MAYRYYLTQRPPSIGTHPKENVLNVEAFDFKERVEEIGRNALGCVEYSEPLTAQQVDNYELTAA